MKFSLNKRNESLQVWVSGDGDDGGGGGGEGGGVFSPLEANLNSAGPNRFF